MGASIERKAQSAGDVSPDVLRCAQAGEPAAREQLVTRYERPVFALLGRMLIPKGRAALVHDLAQETFAQVFQSLPRFDPAGPARLSTWILTIATRVALRELAVPRLVTETLDRAEAVREPDGEEAVEQAALRAAIVRTLSALAPAHQAVLILRAYHDLDYEEIAVVLDVDVGTVKSRLARARAAMRRELGGENG